MAELIKWTASANERSKKVRIDEDVQELLIIRNSSQIVGGQLATGCPETVAIELQDANGNIKYITENDVTLGEMAVYSQFGEGVIPEFVSKDGALPEQSVVRLGLKLASIGIDVQPEDKLYVTIGGAIVGGEYTFEVIETPLVGTNVYQYTKQVILEGTKKQTLDVDDVEAIIFPTTSSSIKKITVQFTNGKTCEYTIPVLQYLNSRANDCEVQQIDSSYEDKPLTFNYGSMTSQFVVLKLGSITEIRVETTGDKVEFVTVKEISLLAA
jgi:hypothetical protein